jgi:hypothetical protein
MGGAVSYLVMREGGGDITVSNTVHRMRSLSCQACQEESPGSDDEKNQGTEPIPPSMCIFAQTTRDLATDQ